MIRIIILIYGGILAAIWALLEVFNQDERVSYKGGIIFSTIFLALQIHITIFSPTIIFMALFFANFQIAGFINHRYDKFTPILESARFASFFFVIFFNLWIEFPIVLHTSILYPF
ncbi:MAG: hypothetical protein EU551_04425 [Promethearchaeota archaeon]|nr:MAG: hypothetical protein EU551_04425 [Candidatus Lokiarchaeota archaeon]